MLMDFPAAVDVRSEDPLLVSAALGLRCGTAEASSAPRQAFKQLMHEAAGRPLALVPA